MRSNVQSTVCTLLNGFNKGFYPLTQLISVTYGFLGKHLVIQTPSHHSRTPDINTEYTEEVFMIRIVKSS